jgi:hypothetical protein
MNTNAIAVMVHRTTAGPVRCPFLSGPLIR